MTRRMLILVVAAVILTGCSTPILANGPLVEPTPGLATAPPSRAPDPIAVRLPRDDGPHDRLTEWWYYTGHLHSPAGRRFGFEAVVFRAERGPVPAAWAAHLALTDEQGNVFRYAQRSDVGPQVDQSPRDATGEPGGFDLRVAGLNPALGATGVPALAPPPWRLAGGNGTDRIEAALTPEEAAAAGAPFGLDLELRSTKPAALHDGDGFVDFGPAGSSYYYSRTRMAAAGELVLEGATLPVQGIAWFDHQWGDFISVGGGWNWFAINLDDGTDITISVVFGANGEPGVEYGTLVAPDGSVRALLDADIELQAASVWASERTGRLYPIDWQVRLRGSESADDLRIDLVPTVLDQEVDARASSGVIYWEGSQRVTATRGSVPLGGEAYVELTRYGP